MFEFSKLTCGDPRHPPLIFLHGFLGVKEDWEAMFPFFEKRFFCIAFDLPGHGSTPYSDDILSELKRALSLFCPSPILIGYSMGGRIILQLQQYAKAIIALSAHPGLATREEKEQRRKSDEEWSENLLNLPFDLFVTKWYAQAIFQTLQHNPPLLERIIRQRVKQNPQDLACILRQLSLADQPHITHFLCPALFLHGEEDLKYRQLYSQLPKTVSIRSIKNCGHVVHLENASHSAEEILNWLEDMHANRR
jgi:2-succinyl-6-hydroxy-2,4-cyclohexadiene-1-carboxylate synthase